MNCVGGLTMPTSASSFVRQFEQLQAKVDKQCRSPEPWVCPDAVTLAEQAGLQLDEWQRSACLSTASRMSLNCSRQSGKSTVASVMAVHTALSEEDALTRSEEHTSELQSQSNLVCRLLL